MTRTIQLVALFAAICLLLASCTIGDVTPSAASNQLLAAETPQASALVLTAQPDTTIPYNTVGQNINIMYTVTNTGTAALPGTVIINGATATCPPTTTVGNKNDSLDPAETLGCASAYPLTQADLDKGSVTLIVSATLNGVNSAPVTVTVATVQPKAVSVTAASSPTTYDQVGRELIITYTIKNIGTQNLGPDPFQVIDKLINATPFNCGLTGATLAPGATLTCSAKYIVSQNDMNGAAIISTSTASGGGAGVSQPFSLTINKGVVTNPGGGTAVPGNTITYTVKEGEWLWQIARCFGTDPNKLVEANKQLPDPAQIKKGDVITVPNVGSTGKVSDEPCVKLHTVQTGETWISIAQLYNADPVITQMVNDNSLAVGSVIKVPRNSAGGTPVLPSTIGLTSTANPTTYGAAGQQITYTYVIKNTGTTNLGPTQFTVTDKLISPNPINCGAANSSLAPGATLTCQAAYAITQANMNEATITNSATASGSGATSSQSTFTINRASQGITLTITPSVTTYETVGEKIIYKYTIRNTGTTTLGPTQFVVNDNLISATPFNCGVANVTLPANSAVECTAEYVVTQNNLNNLSITNTATASAAGVSPSQPASVTVNKKQ
ncbi:MAG TPA: LysM peptidoglycan-binding domain-containing protein [Anaerolineales bacterium]|nr:LysM peptidoglycan-binding domain-containing protein [Anaerolineales bacterium]HNN13606.1 LysM peptidoglycan-binding domain-containing protein [Anaerolineales bacterium]